MRRGSDALVLAACLAVAVCGAACECESAGDAPRAVAPLPAVPDDTGPSAAAEPEVAGKPPATPLEPIPQPDAAAAELVDAGDSGAIAAAAAPEGLAEPKKKWKPEKPPGCKLPKHAYVSGMWDWRDRFHRAMRQQMTRIKVCYERSLAHQPDLAGRVEVKFTIDGVGRVSKAKVVATTLNHKPTEDCVVGAIRRMTFPQPPCGKPVTYNYPFQFTPP